MLLSRGLTLEYRLINVTWIGSFSQFISGSFFHVCATCFYSFICISLVCFVSACSQLMTLLWPGASCACGHMSTRCSVGRRWRHSQLAGGCFNLYVCPPPLYLWLCDSAWLIKDNCKVCAHNISWSEAEVSVVHAKPANPISNESFKKNFLSLFKV